MLDIVGVKSVKLKMRDWNVAWKITVLSNFNAAL